ncbi:MAG TPA: hypothetical protein PLM93_09610 [Sulfuricurvum sp.]|nr:MAG: hypothetical protein B7Y30_04585 [Campylobacterales bacterium 16-40-21]OZA02648.1 MAG: hypothetical protein B7X89_08440 [Sulfuricurvum sp. 17-40-25]HQS67424.1 hypothetical protein [Sulfuricurvum sp.]HQT36464.1 hypothetical protein [Sulfuricurvum sp.]
MATANETIVQNIARGLLFKELSTTDLTYWAKQIEQGFTTPTLLTQLASQTTAFKNENQLLATMYYGAFGKFATIDTMMFWRGIVDNGATLKDVAGRFVNSAEFYAHIPTAAQSNSAKLDALIGTMGVSGITQQTKTEALASITKGSLDWGNIMLYLANVSPQKTTTGLALLSTSITGAVPKLTDITALGSDANLAISKIWAAQTTVATPTTSGNDTYTGTKDADSIRGLGGNDTLTGGTGIDTFIFESTTVGNGIDTITDFAIGKGGDILNFTAFLNKSNTKNNTTVLSTDITAKAWLNGDILIVSGNALTTADTVAALFGTGKAFAAPTTGTKAVIITADIIGDATVWYLVNQTGVTAITADEVVKVATLTGINNLGLVGFESTNLA